MQLFKLDETALATPARLRVSDAESISAAISGDEGSIIKRESKNSERIMCKYHRVLCGGGAMIRCPVQNVVHARGSRVLDDAES